jgi:hypothetical protein
MEGVVWRHDSRNYNSFIHALKFVKGEHSMSGILMIEHKLSKQKTGDLYDCSCGKTDMDGGAVKDHLIEFQKKRIVGLVSALQIESGKREAAEAKVKELEQKLKLLLDAPLITVVK